MARAQWLTPDEIPSATKCRTLTIPDNLDILMAVSGALLDLTFSYNWQQFGAVTPEAMAEAMFAMYRDFVASLNDCEPPMTLPIGTIVQFAAGSLPMGWLYCNGDEVLKASYPALWDTITTLWGVATLGSDYFVLPDFRNRSPYGFDYGSVPAHFPFATKTGAETHTLTTAQIPSHDHDTYELNLWGASGNSGTPAGLAINSSGAVSFTAKTGDTGGGNAHNTLHPVVVCGFIIYAGV